MQQHIGTVKMYLKATNSALWSHGLRRGYVYGVENEVLSVT